jgi:nucleoside-diphosphate-sugar epimerase
MLVLVAGVTGNMGQKLVTSLKTRGHQVRGLGRSSCKLQPEVTSSLEKFVEFSGFDDIPALNTACSGVDAVICAYGMDPSIQLEGQLLLLRATERAGVKIFVAQSWNHDWSELELGQHEA